MDVNVGMYVTVCSAGMHRPVLACLEVANHGICHTAVMKNQYIAISKKIMMEHFSLLLYF